MAPMPADSSFAHVLSRTLLGHALRLEPSGTLKLQRKNGTSSSHGILLKLLRSIWASMSLYPFSLFEIFSSRKYVWSCMSQPKMTEQKPNPDAATERNFFLAMSLPRSTPSMSHPATLTALSFLSKSGRSSRVSVDGSSVMVIFATEDEHRIGSTVGCQRLKKRNNCRRSKITKAS